MARKKDPVQRAINVAIGLAAILASIAIGNGLIEGSLTPTILGMTIPGAILAGWLVVIGGVLAGVRLIMGLVK